MACGGGLVPESWTARGALALTLIFLIAAGVAFLSSPSDDPTQQTAWIELVELQATYRMAWYSQTIQGLTVLATLWGAYGARHLVPTPPGWGRPAITTAELRRAERPASGPTPIELGDV